MDDSGNRENGRHKPDPYRSVHAQEFLPKLSQDSGSATATSKWMMPQHLAMKDHHTVQTIKLMAIIGERDNAVRERDLALSEKKTALAERDMAIFQRDTAIAERNNAIIERDNAIAALEYARTNCNINGSGMSHRSRNINHHHHHHHHSVPHSSSLDSSHSTYDNEGEILTNETLSPSTLSEGLKRRTRKEPKSKDVPSKNASKSPTKNKRGNNGNGDRQVMVVEMNGEWKLQEEMNGRDSLKNQPTTTKKHRKEWKVEDLSGLNEVIFDESTMPVPVCSCTGKYQPCYKWGNGGWQSACCTTILSMYPLPVMPNKRHARVNGRKMSGSVFNKLLSRLASEGHDLRLPLDLKDHWSKHGTNRYITIK